MDIDTPQQASVPVTSTTGPMESPDYQSTTTENIMKMDEDIGEGPSNFPPIALVTPSKKDVEMSKKEKSLAEFLLMMDNYTPIIPDAVTDYYLSRTGFDCDDIRIKRLMALAAQKFIADIATDAFQYCKIRQQGSKKQGKDKKTVLTMEDLSAALSEYGINIKKPDYYT